MFPTIKGSENNKISFAGLPVVILFVMINPPLSFDCFVFHYKSKGEK